MVMSITDNPFLDPDEMDQYQYTIYFRIQLFSDGEIDKCGIADVLFVLHKNVYQALVLIRKDKPFIQIIDNLMKKIRGEYEYINAKERNTYVPVFLKELNICLYNISFLLHSTDTIRCWLLHAKAQADKEGRAFPSIEQTLKHLWLYE